MEFKALFEKDLMNPILRTKIPENAEIALYCTCFEKEKWKV